MEHIGVVIPCFNEEVRLPFSEYESFLIKHPFVHFFFSNDGSVDNTGLMLGEFASRFSNAHFYDFEKNEGKAETIRKSMLRVLRIEHYQFSYLGYWDADLATPLLELTRMLEQYGFSYDAIFGSRVRRLGSLIKRKPLRHYLGRVFATISSQMLNMPVYDTQCGAKLFSMEITRNVFQNPFISKWCFDVEILFRMKAMSKTNVIEHPLESWEDVDGSCLRIMDILKAPVELFRIFLTYRR